MMSESKVNGHAGRTIAGKYRLDKRIGAGGMGEVYLAEHLTLHMPIAIKILHPHRAADPDILRRFYREARASAQLSHPNVIRVLDYGGEGEAMPYLVMEWLEGVTLQHYLTTFEFMMPLSDVGEIMLQVLSAFEAAHVLGIIHRDVKPENMFVTYVAGVRTIKILDFGLAHVELPAGEENEPTLTQPGALAGTPDYMSPEQCYSLTVGPESDIYSLGCVLTTMLQGKPPFAGKRAVEAIAGHLYRPPPALIRPLQAEPVPPLLERLRLDMLAKELEKRPRSATEVRERLQAALDADSSATALVTRKGGEPLGSRISRLPQWDAPTEARDTELAVQNDAQYVMLWCVGTNAGADESCVLGLAAQKIIVEAVSSVDEIVAQKKTVLILDVGGDIEQAIRVLEAIRKKTSIVKTIVCVAGLVPQKMTQLVSAGAADALGSPPSPDLLGRKVSRILRRGR